MIIRLTMLTSLLGLTVAAVAVGRMGVVAIEGDHCYLFVHHRSSSSSSSSSNNNIARQHQTTSSITTPQTRQTDKEQTTSAQTLTQTTLPSWAHPSVSRTHSPVCHRAVVVQGSGMCVSVAVLLFVLALAEAPRHTKKQKLHSKRGQCYIKAQHIVPTNKPAPTADKNTLVLRFLRAKRSKQIIAGSVEAVAKLLLLIHTLNISLLLFFLENNICTIT